MKVLRLFKRLVFVSIGAGLMASSTAFALPTVTFTDGPGTTGGGEFNAATSANGSFITFCIEYTEHLAFNTTYYYEISQAAKYNGNFPNTDPLSRPTAWLYLQFRNGTLSGYTHTDAMADELQKAIWFLEGETGGVNNPFAQLAVTQAGPATVDNNGFYGVGVMNLWGDANGTIAQQDQLILTGTPDQGLPDAGSTMTLLGFAICALGFLHRRFNQSARSLSLKPVSRAVVRNRE